METYTVDYSIPQEDEMEQVLSIIIHNKIMWCLLRADQFSPNWRAARNYTHILLSTRVARNK